jgi:hypothetical protein
MVTTLNVSDNPQVPVSVQQAYLPDQLIAGDKKLVTEVAATVTGAAPLKRGQVLGLMSSGAVGAPVAKAGNTGNAVISAITKGPNYQPGTYAIVYSSATAYTLKDPFGNVVASGVNGPFTSTHLNFTATAGTTPMVAGDTIFVTVALGTGPYKALTSGASDGSQTASAILADDVDPSAGDQRAGIYLSGEFNQRAIIYDTVNFTIDALRPALRTVSIHLKTSLSAADPT